jgi:hypothetical protein
MGHEFSEHGVKSETDASIVIVGASQASDR